MLLANEAHPVEELACPRRRRIEALPKHRIFVHELRARDTVPAMLLFVVAALVVFHFALPEASSSLAAYGLLWVALLFTAILGLVRAFAAERDQGLLDALVLAPCDRSAIWLAKALAMLAFLVLAELASTR